MLGWHYAGGPLPKPAQLYLSIMTVAGPLATALITRKLPAVNQYAWTILASVLFAPYCWDYYSAVTLMPVVLTLRNFLNYENPVSELQARQDERCPA